jgi:hypothetical protein
MPGRSPNKQASRDFARPLSSFKDGGQPADGTGLSEPLRRSRTAHDRADHPGSTNGLKGLPSLRAQRSNPEPGKNSGLLRLPQRLAAAHAGRYSPLRGNRMSRRFWRNSCNFIDSNDPRFTAAL